ncbi:MAG: hypothetical protein KC618_09120, partial [Candidatus Omnitrophica bacterium]|nr:hypothetical protein [Candidatus Omnitrophota bacterium]
MHKRIVTNIIARISIIVCLFMAIPLGWALHDNPHHIEVVAFSETILFGLAMAGIFLWVFRMKPEDYKR